MRMVGIVLVVTSLSMLCACEKKAENASGSGAGDGAGSGISNALDSAKTAATETFTELRDKAVATLEPKLEAAKEQAVKFKDKIASLPEAARPAVESSMAEIEKQIDAAQTQLGKLKDAGADTWKSISTELGAAMDKLGAAMKDLGDKLPS